MRRNQEIFLCSEDKFLQEYFVYFKKIWQSYTEKDPLSALLSSVAAAIWLK